MAACWWNTRWSSCPSYYRHFAFDFSRALSKKRLDVSRQNQSSKAEKYARKGRNQAWISCSVIQQDTLAIVRSNRTTVAGMSFKRERVAVTRPAKISVNKKVDRRISEPSKSTCVQNSPTAQIGNMTNDTRLLQYFCTISSASKIHTPNKLAVKMLWSGTGEANTTPSPISQG